MDTLVLSHAYVPVARVRWQRAITLLSLGMVEVVSEYDDWTVRSVTVEFKVPSIIRFLEKIRDHTPKVKFSRENVYTRDKGCCQYCGMKVPRHEATYDHVKPRCQGGQTKWENVVIACTPCNQRKGDKTPEQAGMHLRSMPVKPAHLPRQLTFLYRKNVPQSWKDWLRSYGYWNAELEHEE